MAKRFGRTIVSDRSIRAYQFSARCNGSDHADVAGNCQSPVMLGLTGTRDKLLRRLDDWRETEVDYADGYGLRGGFSEAQYRNVDIAVRCRRCDKCLRARAAQWRYRMIAEIARSDRTWFGTLTLNPEYQGRLRLEAHKRLVGRGIDPSEQNADEAFAALCRPLTDEWQRYLKRVRKQAKGLRAICVVERHKSGDPHLHCLIHETKDPVRWRHLSECWHWGFVKLNLVQSDQETSAARYVAKYLAKAAVTRIKASVGYGR